MNIFEAINVRHTVRRYDGRPLEGGTLAELQDLIRRLNAEGHLHMQLVNGRADAFAPFTIHYGKWTGVTNYVALVGKDAADLDERCGYYGEQIVLWAVARGLRTGWLDTKYESVPDGLSIPAGERLVLCFAIGFSEDAGRPHKLKSAEQLSTVEGPVPDWFEKGMACAVLAPSAGNQMLFRIHWDGSRLSMTSAPGFLEKVDMGIAKYHFEIGSGIEHSRWEA